jgi:hypothetical protein
VLQTLNTLCEVDTEQAQQAQAQAQAQAHQSQAQHAQQSQSPNQGQHPAQTHAHAPTASELREIALKNTDKVLTDPKHTRQFFGLVNDPGFYTRFGALQLLNTLIANRRTVVQTHFVNAPEYSQTITAVLEEKRDIIRNG